MLTHFCCCLNRPISDLPSTPSPPNWYWDLFGRETPYRATFVPAAVSIMLTSQPGPQFPHTWNNRPPPVWGSQPLYIPEAQEASFHCFLLSSLCTGPWRPSLSKKKKKRNATLEGAEGRPAEEGWAGPGHDQAPAVAPTGTLWFSRPGELPCSTGHPRMWPSRLPL